MRLDVAHECLVDEIKYELMAFSEMSPAAEMHETYQNLSEYFQSLALCHYLRKLDRARFKENLERSACARRFFLEASLREGNNDDRFLALSRCEAFFDALVCGNLKLAADIVAASKADWNGDWEYQDDFCYFKFLHGLVSGTASLQGDQESLLKTFSDFWGDEECPRLEICRALLTRNSEGFAEALQSLIESKSEEDEERRDGVKESNPTFWPRSHLFIEGLALLRLAGLQGIEVADTFPLCPPDALLPVTEETPEDIFRELAKAQHA